jgi:hypothetical protein
VAGTVVMQELLGDGCNDLCKPLKLCFSQACNKGNLRKMIYTCI